MADKLVELIKKLAQENPQFLDGLEKAAAVGMQNDKTALYNIFVKENAKFQYDDVDKILSRHEHLRLDINWNVGEFIYRLVISKRKKLPEKEKKVRMVKNGSKSNASASNTA